MPEKDMIAQGVITKIEHTQILPEGGKEIPKVLVTIESVGGKAETVTASPSDVEGFEEGDVVGVFASGPRLRRTGG